ncbi:MAG: hypothetical protein ACE5I5_13990 [Candidatus Heimdallarchaeota archaeon]
MAPIAELVKLAHIISIVFMSAPLYNLIVVGERVRYGKAPLDVDLYFENIIRGASTRCYVFQLTAMVTGVWLVILRGLSLSALYTNWVLLVKSLLLLTLMGLLSVVHFRIQPSIDKLITRVEGDTIPQEVAKELGPQRSLRKRLAAICLFLVLTSVILAVQVYLPFPAVMTIVLLAVAAAFSLRVYKTAVPYGWI